MGDFAAPAAAANGSSICINSSLSGGLGGAGIGVNNTPNSTPAAPSSNHPAAGGGSGGPGGPGGGSAAVPKHSTVVERLRQRIEGCRRHHVNCENRYQQAQVEQLELERRDTVSLYQRTLEQRAKKSGAGAGKQPLQSKPQQDAEAASAEQRNHTLIMVRAHRARGGRGAPHGAAAGGCTGLRGDTQLSRAGSRGRRYLSVCRGCQTRGPGGDRARAGHDREGRRESGGAAAEAQEKFPPTPPPLSLS